MVREPDDRAASALVNEDKLLQVVLNLVGNALQATSDGGRVRVGVIRDGEHAVLEVQDDGPGIPPEVVERIWEPFFTTKGAKGTGLGLGITRRIVEEHGGRISVRTRPNEGAMFRVELPYHLVRDDT
jgi:signal transduction histidine kinase